MASRRANAARPRPESFDTSARYRLSEFPQSDVNRAMLGNDLDVDIFSLVNRGCSFGISQFGDHASHQQSLPNMEYAVPFGSGVDAHEPEPQLLRAGISDSPPDVSASITPTEQDYPSIDELMPMADSWDQTSYDQLLGMGPDSDPSTAFDMANILDFMGSQQISLVSNGFLEPDLKGFSHSYRSVEPVKTSPTSESSSLCPAGSMDLDFLADQSASSDGSEGLLASQESWPFFSCNRSPKSDFFPPTTAAIYVEGLTRVLNGHDWQISREGQHRDAEIAVNEILRREEIMDPTVGHFTETLNAATQAILQKACTTHRTDRDSTVHASSNTLNGKENKGTIQLPPPNTIARFVESYVTHHKPYYVCAADLTHLSVPMLQSNVPASRLLMLMTIAQGAAFFSIPAARYLASGLIEACRLFLFESIEKDILLSRDPTVLHSALLFTTAAAWSGDNWHMDIAMGQRGMYISVSSDDLSVMPASLT